MYFDTDWNADFRDLDEDKGLREALREDDVQLFVRIIDNKLEDMFRTFGHKTPQRVLCYLLGNYPLPIKCLEALITGQTPLTVNVNLPCTDTGLYPIHFACWACEAPLVELLLYYGARTDVRFPNSGSVLDEPYHNLLPLQAALVNYNGFFNKELSLDGWIPMKPIYKFLKFLLPICVPETQFFLESIALLAGKTEQTAEIFLLHAIEGSIVPFVALLVVARTKVLGVIDFVRKYFDSIEKYVGEEYEFLVTMRMLVEVFEKAGDEISAYVKQDRYNVSLRVTVVDVLHLLQRAGFNVHPSEPDILNLYMYFARLCSHKARNPRRHLNDFGMAHYSKSGYRWEVSINDPSLKSFNAQAYMRELQKEIDGLKEENVSIIRQQEKPNLQIWMDDELRNALERDDKDKFLSVIDSNMDIFRSRQQLLLYAVCESGSIKCAEALIKGKTPLVVDLNLPCTDSGMYPLHCASFLSLPSFTELFLYNGARANVRFRPSDNFPQHHLLEAHTDKLPLHMALLAISRSPCLDEWSPEQSVFKLVTLLCLPRMQNALETLCLVANMTEGVKDEMIQFAMDGKILELAALFIAAEDDNYRFMLDIIREVDKPSGLLSSDQRGKLKEFAKVFAKARTPFYRYLLEDKHNVTKDQVSEDVRRLFERAGFSLCFSDTDLSIYNWYRDEEQNPSKGLHENVRLLHDVGMEHYSKLPSRWDVYNPVPLRKEQSMTQASIKKLENELQCLKKENDIAKEQLKQVAAGIPCVIHHGLPIASSSLLLGHVIKDKDENKLCGGRSHNLFSRTSKASVVLSRNTCTFPNFSLRTKVSVGPSNHFFNLPHTLSAIWHGKPKTCIGVYKRGQEGFGIHVYQTRLGSIPDRQFFYGTYGPEWRLPLWNQF